MDNQAYRLNVNGQTITADDPTGSVSLASVLREQAGLKATKVACARGECGACTVLVGGRPTQSCVTPVALVDESVETLEGVAEEITDLREEFADTGAFQCGFCTPGQLMQATAILRDPGLAADRTGLEDYVRALMSGNICRCTGYQAITASVCAVLKRRAISRQAHA